MIRLPESLAAWGTPGFDATLKSELERVDADALPLQQGLSASSYTTDSAFEVMVIGASAREDAIKAKVGIFYAGIIAGCSCADDPTPVEENAEYCEAEVAIDRRTGQATVSLCD